MTTTTLRRRTILFATAVYWIALFMLTHTRITMPVLVPSNDKTAHFIGYFVLGAALYTTLRLMGRREPVLIVLVIGLSYGAIDEWLQIPVGRNCELADWFADAAGIAVAVSLGGIITRWRAGRPQPTSW